MMMVQEVARVLHAKWHGEDVLFTGVSTDSRTVKRGDLFVALSGKNFDGHKFVARAKEKGAVAAMVSQESAIKSQDLEVPMILVKDTRLGLGQLAAYWRGRFTIPLVAVTGSNGKTTVKEMIASILQQLVGEVGKVLATVGNLNNNIGVPQMLLQLREQHEYAVIEMGMNHFGEISYLTRLAKPSVALITNAGTAHIEELGSVEGVARAKGEVFEGLDKLVGIAVINADDSNAQLWRNLAGSRPVIDFGLRKGTEVGGYYQLNLADTEMKLKLPDGVVDVKLKVPGEHNVRNALAAAAAAVAMGISKENIVSGLGRFSGVKGRLQKKRCQHDAMLIDDSYNANPESVRAALAVLAKCPGKKILVLGDMGQLGENTVDFHERIGEEARLIGIDRLFALGELSAHSVMKFGKGAQHFMRIEDLLTAVETLLAPNVTLLVKGSRFMQMERVVKNFEL